MITLVVLNYINHKTLLWNTKFCWGERNVLRFFVVEKSPKKQNCFIEIQYSFGNDCIIFSYAKGHLIKYLYLNIWHRSNVLSYSGKCSSAGKCCHWVSITWPEQSIRCTFTSFQELLFSYDPQLQTFKMSDTICGSALTMKGV